MHKFVTDIGVKRKENQDNGGYWDNGFYSLSILCDGMGGHFGGSIASGIVIEHFAFMFNDILPKTFHTIKFLQDWMISCIAKIKKTMKQKVISNPHLLDMGTTLVAALINNKNQQLLVFNIGDSRAYLLGKSFKQITIDQNVSNHFIQKEGLSHKKATSLSNANKLTSSLGPNKRTKIDIYVIEPNIEYKMLILTSDGIHNYVEDTTFELILNNNNFNINQKAFELINNAKKNGSLDNLSIFIKELG